MSLRSTFVDRARRVHRVVGYRDPVLGESEQLVQYGDWYKVRLAPPDSTENHPENEAVQYRMQAELIMPVDFELDLNDRIEIESKELNASGIWLIVAQPKYIRKKRAVIGKTCAVLKVTTM